MGRAGARRPDISRSNNAAASCPFCLTMMTDGVAAKNDQVKVRDVSELMLEEN
jgi:Fe-S oxidoreductase|tara:strand:+ start:44 stop:202 length:159 start_codon:yes stop_codon:yes gene_type:complete